MTYIEFKLLAAVAAALSPISLSGMTNLITGEVTNNVTWSGTNLLRGMVIIRPTAAVAIDAGTRLLMNTGATLRIEGQLLANGTSNQPITFTRATTSTNWGRILFVRAAPSRLQHCVIEFANSTGDHQSYYDNDCNTNTPPVPRNYREAVIALATHLDIENCVFRNLPFNTGARDGDAIAIISDDPQNPGPASAHVRNCTFVSIGQGVHTRFAYVLVEHCFFSDKRGDNDDVDLYGESTPRPIIRFNTFLGSHEDKINPTRCSAIIYGNVISGGDDHGVVLRDRCSPIVVNNLIYNFTNACIAVQNQCDALIANNTILNSRRGIRFFDHFDRHGPPYCLFPGSGRATIVNCVIRNCRTSFELTDSPDGHSHAAVYHSNIQGGRASASVSANATLVWGMGNIDLDPRFAGLATNNYRLQADSPCIDSGTNVSVIATNFDFAITNDFDGVPRPLDGNGDGLARFDMGAFEFLLATADSNGDGIPDEWTWRYGLDPTDSSVALSNPDEDPHTTFQEWVADTNPVDGLSRFRVAAGSTAQSGAVYFLSSSNRQYTLFRSTNLTVNAGWSVVPGQMDMAGNGEVLTLHDTNSAPLKFYKVGVKVP
jgi:hypothetical protein